MKTRFKSSDLMALASRVKNHQETLDTFSKIAGPEFQEKVEKIKDNVIQPKGNIDQARDLMQQGQQIVEKVKDPNKLTVFDASALGATNDENHQAEEERDDDYNPPDYSPDYEADGLENQRDMQAFDQENQLEQDEEAAENESSDNQDENNEDEEGEKEDKKAPEHEVKIQKIGDKIIHTERSKGLKHGITSIKNKKGRLEIQSNYVRNKLDGVTKYYYSDGKIEREITFKQGKIHGLMTSFHTNGKKAMEVEYENGQMHGLSMVYDESGLAQVISNYQKGKLHGEMTLLSNGTPYLKKMYDQGIEVSHEQGSQHTHSGHTHSGHTHSGHSH